MNAPTSPPRPSSVRRLSKAYSSSYLPPAHDRSVLFSQAGSSAGTTGIFANSPSFNVLSESKKLYIEANASIADQKRRRSHTKPLHTRIASRLKKINFSRRVLEIAFRIPSNWLTVAFLIAVTSLVPVVIVAVYYGLIPLGSSDDQNSLERNAVWIFVTSPFTWTFWALLNVSLFAGCFPTAETYSTRRLYISLSIISYFIQVGVLGAVVAGFGVFPFIGLIPIAISALSIYVAILYLQFHIHTFTATKAPAQAEPPSAQRPPLSASQESASAKPPTPTYFVKSVSLESHTHPPATSSGRPRSLIASNSAPIPAGPVSLASWGHQHLSAATNYRTFHVHHDPSSSHQSHLTPTSIASTSAAPSGSNQTISASVKQGSALVPLELRQPVLSTEQTPSQSQASAAYDTSIDIQPSQEVPPAEENSEGQTLLSGMDGARRVSIKWYKDTVHELMKKNTSSSKLLPAPPSHGPTATTTQTTTTTTAATTTAASSSSFAEIDTEQFSRVSRQYFKCVLCVLIFIAILTTIILIINSGNYVVQRVMIFVIGIVAFIFKKILLALTDMFPHEIAMLISGLWVEHLPDVFITIAYPYVSNPKGTYAVFFALTFIKNVAYLLFLTRWWFSFRIWIKDILINFFKCRGCRSSPDNLPDETYIEDERGHSNNRPGYLRRQTRFFIWKVASQISGSLFYIPIASILRYGPNKQDYPFEENTQHPVRGMDMLTETGISDAQFLYSILFAVFNSLFLIGAMHFGAWIIKRKLPELYDDINRAFVENFMNPKYYSYVLAIVVSNCLLIVALLQFPMRIWFA